MSERIATPVVKDKFWVVEEQGTKIATIQAKDDGGFVYVHDDQREYFPSVKILKQKYNIKFANKDKQTKAKLNHLYGYPVSGRAYNQVYDVRRRLPVYSKTAKSKSLFCAGYYLIKFNGTWTAAFCPKNITLNRYPFTGPFTTEEEMNLHLRILNDAES